MKNRYNVFKDGCPPSFREINTSCWNLAEESEPEIFRISRISRNWDNVGACISNVCISRGDLRSRTKSWGGSRWPDPCAQHSDDEEEDGDGDGDKKEEDGDGDKKEEDGDGDGDKKEEEDGDGDEKKEDNCWWWWTITGGEKYLSSKKVKGSSPPEDICNMLTMENNTWSSTIPIRPLYNAGTVLVRNYPYIALEFPIRPRDWQLMHFLPLKLIQLPRTALPTVHQWSYAMIVIIIIVITHHHHHRHHCDNCLCFIIITIALESTGISYFGF